ncbi:VanZ family protein [Waterburya agarophytonicola K14]|uniref:VanZ family protein n=1 Tax=Waterburya agarophytonicola KI4 TaxID=2874699 RepID=A0A964BM53_9CYAN|nr:VanZ family protein [Waterburya agarophytonicola]MCC0175599.1 VanZ family protein [Waterburya agarophytonicola KI4]
MISPKTRYYILLIGSLVAIATVTIYPFNFIIPEKLYWIDVVEKFHVFTNVKDYIRNILLFISFGIAWGGILNYKKYDRGEIILFAFLLSAMLSTNIELIQILLPSRTSSLSDIACNSLGGLSGSSLYCWRKDFSNLINGTITRQYQQINLKFLATIILGYCGTIICAFTLFVNSINLNNWNNDAYLSLASEVTEQIFWQGYITSLYICDRSLNTQEIDQAFHRTHSFFSTLPNSIVSLLLLDYRSSYGDNNQQIPNLHWHQELPAKKINSLPSIDTELSPIDDLIHNQKSVLFEQKNSLISDSPFTQLNQKIKASQEFSLSVILATNKFKQVGPSRIISLGENIYSRNLMLGQENSNLIFRLRTSTTGDNANQPGFYFPNFFKNKDLHQILITYAQNKLTFYLDRPEDKYTFTFQPSTHLKLFLPWNLTKWNVNLQNHNPLQSQITFYSLVLSPLVLLSGIFILCSTQKVSQNK